MTENRECEICGEEFRTRYATRTWCGPVHHGDVLIKRGQVKRGEQIKINAAARDVMFDDDSDIWTERGRPEAKSSLGFDD